MEIVEKDILIFLSLEIVVQNVEVIKLVRKLENCKKFQRKYVEECFRCGNNYYFSECRFKESKCFKCKKWCYIFKKCLIRKKIDKLVYFVNRGDGNIFDFEDSICFIFCINEIDSSIKKFIVKIIVGCENVDFLVDIGSVCIFIGKFMFRN